MFKDDCYRLLQVSPDADEKTIRRAYRERSKELHPDVNPSPDAAAKFAKLSAAVNVLLDATQRLKHDDHFGYNKSIRNQDSNAKQQYSDFQKNKAEKTVKGWMDDFYKASAMRERQREKHVKQYKRSSLLVWVVLIVVLSASAFFVVRVFLGK